jgi:outer membrane protein OmpA-like peptidoglycan-associated protein/opacity protein-like surface antigen
MKRVVLPVALIIAAASPANAGTTNSDLGKYYATGTVHFLTTDHERFADLGANDGFGGHVGLGMKFTDRVSVELKLGAQQIDVNTGGSKGQQDAILDLRYQLSNGPTRAFALLGGGQVKTDLAGGGDSSHPMIRFGLGVDFELSNNIDLRTQIVARRIDDFESVPGVEDFTDVETAVGLVYWFNDNNDAAKPKPASIAPPVIATVEPKPVVVAPLPRPTPKPMPSPAKDSDRDGTVDTADNCPNTPPHSFVDSRGCPLKDLAGADAVRFGNDLSSLNPIATTKLDKVVALLRTNPMAKARIVGHADNTGSLAYNVKLSERRAESALAYLIGKGISSDRLTKQAYGEVRPLGDNSTSAGRAANRRVEVLFGK